MTRYRSETTFIEWVVYLGILAVIIVTLAAFFGHGGCTDRENTIRVLRAEGYKNIEITGWRPWSGSDDDAFHTGFRAISPGGEEVTGTVTSGWLKGHTTRLD